MPTPHHHHHLYQQQDLQEYHQHHHHHHHHNHQQHHHRHHYDHQTSKARQPLSLLPVGPSMLFGLNGGTFKSTNHEEDVGGPGVLMLLFPPQNLPILYKWHVNIMGSFLPGEPAGLMESNVRAAVTTKKIPKFCLAWERLMNKKLDCCKHLKYLHKILCLCSIRYFPSNFWR